MSGTKGSVYMRWAKDHAAARYNLANSGLLGCGAEDLELAPGDLQGLLMNGANADGYPPLLAAIAAAYGASAEQVVTAQGASGANFLAFATVLEPGDEVLVERPTYEPLLAALAFLGARVRRFERRFEDAWRLDPDALRPHLSDRVRLVVLTSPHNPSGVAADPADLAEVVRLAEARGALVLVDEVYRDALFEDAPPSHVHLGPNVLATSSLTKSYGLSGLRCGWVLAPLAGGELASRMLRVRDLMAAADSMPSDALALAAFRQLPRLAERARAILKPNRELVRAFLAEHADRLACVVPRRSMVVFPRLEEEETSDPLHDRLRPDTSIVPGRFFAAPRHFRLGFALRHEDVARGLENLGRALRK